MMSGFSQLRVLKLAFRDALTDEMFSIFKGLSLEELRIASYSMLLTDQAFIDLAGIQAVGICSVNVDVLINISTRGYRAVGGQQRLNFAVPNSLGVYDNFMVKFERTEGVCKPDETRSNYFIWWCRYAALRLTLF